MEKQFIELPTLTNEQIASLPITSMELIPAKEGQRIIPCLDEDSNMVGAIIIDFNYTKSTTI